MVRGGGGGGRGGGKGRHSDQQSRETTISKAISFVLRHGAAKEGLKLDENGYANAADLVRGFFSLTFLFFSGVGGEGGGFTSMYLFYFIEKLEADLKS